MKKHRKFWFVFSVAAQLLSYIGAAVMMFKKKKGTAGFLAALGFIGTLIAAAAISSVPDKNKQRMEQACDNIKKDLEKARFAQEQHETEAQLATDDDESNPHSSELYNQVSMAFDGINLSDTETADQPDMADDLEKIERAIDILKNAGNPDSELDDALQLDK